MGNHIPTGKSLRRYRLEQRAILNAIRARMKSLPTTQIHMDENHDIAGGTPAPEVTPEVVETPEVATEETA